MPPARSTITSLDLLDRLVSRADDSFMAASGAVSGRMAATLLASLAGSALDEVKSEKVADELAAIRDRALSLRRDLEALVDQAARAESAIAEAGRREGPADDPRRLRAILFASEVPLRIAESCHALLNLTLRALGRIGIKAISPVGATAALAFTGVVTGILVARTHLAAIPSGSGIGAEAARRRAERIFREAEALRTQIIDRVRQHLP